MFQFSTAASPPEELNSMSTNFTEVDLTWKIPASPNGNIREYKVHWGQVNLGSFRLNLMLWSKRTVCKNTN